MRKFAYVITASVLLAAFAPAALAVTPGEVRRVDPASLELRWSDADTVWVYASPDPEAALEQATLVSEARGGSVVVPAPQGQRLYFILKGADGKWARTAERELPLAQGSNFRDAGGYLGKDGRRVKWGKIFRSGAMPLLTEEDYALLEQLRLGTVVDLRSLDERQIAPTLLDDRVGAQFVSNDYSLRVLMAEMMKSDGENLYRGVEKRLAPQFRSLMERLLAGDGSVVYHCSAGQDRTGVATALVYEVLGVPRETILRDYHLSTELRRPQFEMPPLDPADWPGNRIVPYYVRSQANPEGPKAEPLYSPSGASHLAQFFAYIDQEYGSVAGYLESELHFTPAEQERLRAMYLE